MALGRAAYYPVSLLRHDDDTPSKAAHAYDEPVDEEGIRIRDEQSVSQKDDADPDGQAAQNSKDQNRDNADHVQEAQAKAHDE